MGKTLDLRGVEPSKRHTLVLSEFDELRDGEELTVIADHYPAHLIQLISGKIKRYNIEERGDGTFELKLIKGSRPLVSHVSKLRRTGDAYSVPAVRKEEYGVILVFLEPGQYVPVHAPLSDLVFYVIKGEGKATVGDREEEIEEGSIVIVPKGERRGIKAETYMEALHMVIPSPSPQDHEKVMAAAAKGLPEVELSDSSVKDPETH
ncbi:MAG: DUF2249 domain-containing protein [Metallosphaera sp.]